MSCLLTFLLLLTLSITIDFSLYSQCTLPWVLSLRYCHWQVSLKPHTIYLNCWEKNYNLASSNVTCLKALSSEHHWLTFCVMITCNFMSSLIIHNYTSTFYETFSLELAITIAKIQDCSSDLNKWMSHQTEKQKNNTKKWTKLSCIFPVKIAWLALDCEQAFLGALGRGTEVDASRQSLLAG